MILRQKIEAKAACLGLNISIFTSSMIHVEDMEINSTVFVFKGSLLAPS